MDKTDNWKYKSTGMLCKTCMYFVPKGIVEEWPRIGRCRRRAPTLGGWPVVFTSDWCGDHKLEVVEEPEFDSNFMSISDNINSGEINWVSDA